MMCLLALSAVAETTITFTAGTDKGTNTTATAADKVSKDGITIECTTGAFNAAQFRFAKNSTTTFTSTVGNITKVEFTCTVEGTTKYGPGCFSDASAGTYTYAGKIGTWTGNAESFTLKASSNQVRATQIVVTVGEADPTKVADPVFSPAAGTFYQAQNVTITTGTAGAKIYYTTDGTDPTAQSTAYSSPIGVSTTTTIKAIAINGDYKSQVVSAEYVIAEATPVANIAAFNAVDDNTVVKFSNPVTVVAANGKNTYVKDDSGYGFFYGTTGQTYKTGDQIPAGFTGKKVTYNGKPELSVYPTDGFAAASGNTPIEPELIQLADVSADLWGHLVQVQGVTYTGKSSCKDNSGTGSWYSGMGAANPDTTGNVSYNVIAVIGAYKSKTATDITYQLLPITNTQVGGGTTGGDGLTVAQFQALADNSSATMGSVVALAQGNSRLFVKDETGYMLIYGNVGQTYKLGDVIPGGFTGTKTTWDGEPELQKVSGMQAASGSVTVTPEVITLTSGILSHANFGHLVTIKNVTINGTNIVDAAGSAPFYNTLGANVPGDGGTYDLLAIVGSHGKTNTVYQLLPVEFTKPGGGEVALPEVANIAGLYGLAQNTNAKITGKLTAIYQNGNNLYVKDDAGTYGLVYGKLTNAFSNGDQITGAVASWKSYYDVKELIPVDSTFIKSGSVAAVEPIEVTAEDISQDMLHQYLVVKGATLTDSTLTDETGVVLVLFNKFKVTMPTDLSKKYTVKLFPTIYKSALELYPVEITDESAGVKGDLNGDGKVNAGDVTVLVNMISGAITPDLTKADLNGDGQLNVGDVTLLVNLILGTAK